MPCLEKKTSTLSVSFPTPIKGFDDFGHIALDTMPNTRDLGGMPTEDGLRVKPRKLVRSGELHNISDEDAVQVLGEHDVRRVIDLRTEQEADSAPDDDIIKECAEYRHLPVFGVSAIGITHDNGLGGNLLTAFDALGDIKGVVKDSYEDALLGDMGIAAYQDMLSIIAESGNREGATLWHCSAGKDRTGLGAIIVEHILGVSEENIKRDYLATNIFSFSRNKQMPYCLAPIAKRVGFDIEPVFYVFEEYYDYVTDIISREFGSMEGYVRNALNLPYDCLVEQMRHDYLE